MPIEKPTNLHKRLAMGDTIKGYAKGGSIGCAAPATVKVGAAKNPLTAARRNNGVRGMKDGGKTC
jgi:hypothetical protein